MLALLRDLVAHKGHANAALLSSVHQSPVAAADPDVCQLLHHVLVANRFWTLSILGLPFNAEEEERLLGIVSEDGGLPQEFTNRLVAAITGIATIARDHLKL